MPNLIEVLNAIMESDDASLLMRMAGLAALYDRVWIDGECSADELHGQVADWMPRDFFDGLVASLVKREVIRQDGDKLTPGICENCGDECWRPEVTN